MTAKLHIDLKQGLIDVEGSEELVRSIYADFKGVMATGNAPIKGSTPAPVLEIDGKVGAPAPKRQTKSSDKRSDFTPVFNRNLDTAKLPAFYGQYEPKNHAEKILIFVHFLKEELQVEPCSAHDIFTCYTAMKGQTATPKAFAQTIRDAARKPFHYIDVVSWDEITIPIAGMNHFNMKLSKKGAAE